MPYFDTQAVKEAAEGRWLEIITALTSIPREVLDGKHHSCPECGGNDRFNFDRDGKGIVYCNNHNGGGKWNSGDGIGTVAWALKIKQGEAIEKIGTHLGLKPKQQDAAPDRKLRFIAFNEAMVARWCQKKKPITVEAVKAIGGRCAAYSTHMGGESVELYVIAFPVYGPGLSESDIVGWVIYKSCGGMLPHYPKKGNLEWRKVLVTHGSKKGVMCDVSKFSQPLEGKTVWKTEGPPDLLSLLAKGLNPDHVAFTTANGAGELPLDWTLKRLNGANVLVVHDADQPGQRGATWDDQADGRKRPGWAPILAKVANSVRNVRLPFPIEHTHGKDLRDYFLEDHSFEDLVDLSKSGELFESKAAKQAEDYIEEEIDDPQRLARINLRQYEDNHGGRLVFWRDEWWKWKSGRYRKIELGELKPKVWESVRKEFERHWREERKNAVRKPTRALVANVIGAMESMCYQPFSIEMPCWIPDRSQPHYVSLSNGILNLDGIFEGQPAQDCIFPHSSSWFSAVGLDYPFDPSAKCPLFIDYLEYSMEGDQQRIDLLQEWAGYLLTSKNEFQRFLALEGEGGNGKTVYFAAMTAMIGEGNVSNVALENFGDRFALSTTIGKAVNISGDAGEIDSVAEGIIKQFTGGDAMFFDRKGIGGINCPPTAKLMCAWNSRPRFRDKSDGIWRRMLIVPFTRQVDPNRRVRGMDQAAWWIRQNEVSGILNWAIIGLDRLRQQGDFTRPRVSEAAIESYKASANPAAEFLNDFVSVEIGQEIFTEEIYSLYVYWCQKNNYRPMASNTFGAEVRRKFGVERKRKRFGGKMPYFYENLKFIVDEIEGKKIESEF